MAKVGQNCSRHNSDAPVGVNVLHNANAFDGLLTMEDTIRHLWEEGRRHKDILDSAPRTQSQKWQSSPNKLAEWSALGVQLHQLFSILSIENLVESEVLLTTEESSLCLLDSSASYHVIPHRSQFRQYLTQHSVSVKVEYSQHYAIIGISTVELNHSGGSTLVLHNVRHVLELSRPLISVGQMDKDGIRAGCWHKRLTPSNLYPSYCELIIELWLSI